MDKSAIGLIVFIACYIGGRIISEKSLRTLTEEERGKLFGGFSKFRIFSLLGIVAIVVVYFAVNASLPNSRFSTGPAFVGVLVAYMFVTSLIGFLKLKRLAMPDGYINGFLASTLVQFIGIFVFFGFLLDRGR